MQRTLAIDDSTAELGRADREIDGPFIYCSREIPAETLRYGPPQLRLNTVMLEPGSADWIIARAERHYVSQTLTLPTTTITTVTTMHSVEPQPPAEPSLPELENLARSHVYAFLPFLRPHFLAPTLLTHAAEIAGRDIPAGDYVRYDVESILLGLLKHQSAFVREGAVHGLAYHLTATARDALVALLDREASPGVRRTIEDVLSD